MRMLAVGVTGRARHGKDTVADMFVADGFTKFSFASALKELAYRINPILRDARPRRLATVIDELGEEKAKQLPELRRFYQYLGTEARHVLGPDVWVNAVKKDAQRLVAHGHPVVFSDVRFPNEAELVRDLGGIVIRVVRPSFDNGVDPTHPSESQVDDLGHAFTLYNVPGPDGYGPDGWKRLLLGQLEDKMHQFLMEANFHG